MRSGRQGCHGETSTKTAFEREGRVMVVGVSSATGVFDAKEGRCGFPNRS
jgi:hypothetical protein